MLRAEAEAPESWDARPLVSVVMPFLNPGSFFVEAIESVLGQTWNHWELLLVNDGSSDGSAEIAREYAGSFGERIRCLCHPGGKNEGMSASRNLGMADAKGDYLAFLDADDVWLPQKLERQVAIMEKHPEVAMTYGASILWYSWDKKAEHPDYCRVLGVEADQVVTPPRMAALYLRGEAQTPGTCSVLLRRSIAEAVGGSERSFHGMYEDQVLFYKICLTYPVYINSGAWDLYRQHRSSYCHMAVQRGEYRFSGTSPAHRVFLQWVRKYLDDQQIEDPGVRRAFANAEWPYRHPAAYRLGRVARGMLRWLRRGWRNGLFVRREPSACSR